MTSNGSLTAVVADDEQLARDELCFLLGQLAGVEVVGQAANGAEALDEITRHSPDVAFLDVQMPGADGFRVLALAGAGTRVVFITAHAEHAVRAFDAQAADYLLKPLSYPRLRAAIERLQPAGEAPSPKYAVRLTVQAGARLRVLDVGAIDCLVAQANYVEVEAGDQRHRVRDTLAGLEARLDPEAFVRIHRSRIVRIAAIRDLELLDSGELLLRLENGRRLSTGRRYRERLRQAVGLAS